MIEVADRLVSMWEAGDDLKAKKKKEKKNSEEKKRLVGPRVLAESFVGKHKTRENKKAYCAIFVRNTNVLKKKLK